MTHLNTFHAKILAHVKIFPYFCRRICICVFFTHLHVRCHHAETGLCRFGEWQIIDIKAFIDAVRDFPKSSQDFKFVVTTVSNECPRDMHSYPLTYSYCVRRFCIFGVRHQLFFYYKRGLRSPWKA